MEIENWSDIAPAFVKVPLNAYKYRHTLQKWWKQLLVYSSTGATNIVVTGRASVGKSVMASYLYGETNSLSWELPETSKDVESKALTLGDWTSIVRVIPGQTGRERYRGLNEAFNSSKKLEGIIYVVDWGFTDVRDHTVKTQMIESAGISTIQNLRAFNLEAELEDFALVCEEVKRTFALGRAPRWLMIIANKADLYYAKEELDLAQRYYHPEGDSKFSKLLQSAVSTVGAQRLKCVSLPLCSFERNLEWNGNFVETRIAGEENRKALRMNFFTKISNL